MNKLKTSIAELRSYLGKDSQGLNLLERITRISNEYRKEAARLKEDYEVSESTKSNALAEARDLRSELGIAKKEIKKLEQKASQLGLEADRLKSQLDNLQSENERLISGEGVVANNESSLSEGRDYYRCFCRLKRDLPTAPGPIRRIFINDLPESQLAYARDFGFRTDSIGVFDITDIAFDYSSVSYERLGRFAMLATMFWGGCGFVSEDSAVKDSGKAISGDQRVSIYRWWSKNAIDTRTQSEILSGVGLRGGTL